MEHIKHSEEDPTILFIKNLSQNVWLLTKSINSEVLSLISDDEKNELIKSEEILKQRAFILNFLLNPEKFLENNSSIKLEEVELLIKEYIPLIAIYENKKLVFANSNYINVMWEPLWVNNLEDLKTHVDKNWLIKESYESWLDMAENSVKTLNEWFAYFWNSSKILSTKSWKIIDWHSFWDEEWVNIRIWSNITNWFLSNNNSKENSDEEYEKLAIDTKKEINNYKKQISNILDNNRKEFNIRLLKDIKLFEKLSDILDFIWTYWPFSMNIINDWKLEINPKYLAETWYEIKDFEKWDFWKLVYPENDDENNFMINNSLRLLDKQNFYTEKFWITTKDWNKNPLNWLRIKIDSKTNFWIWNNIKTQKDIDLEKLAQEEEIIDIELI